MEVEQAMQKEIHAIIGVQDPSKSVTEGNMKEQSED